MQQLNFLETLEQPQPVCSFCKKIFEKKNHKQIYCSSLCGNKKWRSENLEKCRAFDKKYYYENREKKLKQKREYWKSPQGIKTRRKYQKDKYSSDINFKLKRKSRDKIRCILLTIREAKDQKRNIDLIGCNRETLKKHFESKFKEGMTWDNYGIQGWTVDHIIPYTQFDLTDPEQLKKCSHYTNLQPLWWYENIAKGSKIKVYGGLLSVPKMQLSSQSIWENISLL